MSGLAELTYVDVLVAVLANQLCLPIPSIIFLMAAGAMSATGKMHITMILCLGVAGCLIADTIWFCLGRRWGSQAMRLLCRISSDPRECARNAHEKFRRHGLPLLCVAKFLPGVDGLLPPLAGAEGVPVLGFLALDFAGSFLWSGVYTGLGYVFSNQVDSAARLVDRFGAVVSVALAAPIGLYTAWRGLAMLRMIHRLRLRRISPSMLHRKLKSGRNIAVLDLLQFEETDTERSEVIPGSIRLDPARLRRSPHLTIPEDIEMIFYSSSGGDAVSVRAAMGLKRIGINNVWVLEGGLKGWRQKGFPVSPSPAKAEVVAERLGIKLPEASFE